MSSAKLNENPDWDRLKQAVGRHTLLKPTENDPEANDPDRIPKSKYLFVERVEEGQESRAESVIGIMTGAGQSGGSVILSVGNLLFRKKRVIGFLEADTDLWQVWFEGAQEETIFGRLTPI